MQISCHTNACWNNESQTKTIPTFVYSFGVKTELLRTAVLKNVDKWKEKEVVGLQVVDAEPWQTACSHAWPEHVQLSYLLQKKFWGEKANFNPLQQVCY